MADTETVVDTVLVHELREEIPREFDDPPHRPRPRDRRGTYFVGVND